MVPKIKIDLEKRLAGGRDVFVEIGAGRKRRGASVITVDKVDLDTVDIVADIECGLDFFPDNCVRKLYCRSVLEHIENFEYLMGEILRVLADDGKAYIFVPHFSNPYFYSDYTHKRFFGLYSFYYFVETDKQLKRKVPDFYTGLRIEIVSLRLNFKTPFWISRHLKKMFGMLVNSCRSTKEFYELHLCRLVPCDGVEVVFKKASSK
ncbi:MAG: methyltransferase domain-containing protein [Desulfobacterales bacterium]